MPVRLLVEGCDAAELARSWGTRCYVFSEGQLRDNARRTRASFEEAWPHGPIELLPAFKAAPSLAIRAILDDEPPAPVLVDDQDGRWQDVRIAYVDDPDGFVVELIERPRA